MRASPMAGNFLPSWLYLVNATVATVSMKVNVACSMISASALLLLHYLHAHLTEAVIVLLGIFYIFDF